MFIQSDYEFQLHEIFLMDNYEGSGMDEDITSSTNCR